ncbi:hypothetical protein GOBAR_DD36441 [Gossypium barbadense]|nr:hypothetical protein GOBAR_DD36441 [Gossypium barbadense]
MKVVGKWKEPFIPPVTKKNRAERIRKIVATKDTNDENMCRWLIWHHKLQNTTSRDDQQVVVKMMIISLLTAINLPPNSNKICSTWSKGQDFITSEHEPTYAALYAIAIRNWLPSKQNMNKGKHRVVDSDVGADEADEDSVQDDALVATASTSGKPTNADMARLFNRCR